MALRDYWRRDRDPSERTRFPLDPLSRESWHDEAEARYGEHPYRNASASEESRQFNDRWQNSYSGAGYRRFEDRPQYGSGNEYGRDEYGGSSSNPFLGDHPLTRAGSAYDSDYFGSRGLPTTPWRGEPDRRARDELVYGGARDERGQPRSYGTGEFRGRGPRGYQRSDERIKEDACQCLTDDPHIDASNIDVSVKEREVILSGTVQSRAEKRHAEDLIENIRGVRDVINSLRVSSDAQSTSQSMSYDQTRPSTLRR
jgi:hypothetical protein